MNVVSQDRTLDATMAAGAIVGGRVFADIEYAVNYLVEAYSPLTVQEFVDKSVAAGIFVTEQDVHCLINDNIVKMGRRGIPITELTKFCGPNVEGLDFNDHLLWTEDFKNLVVNVGLDDSLDKHLKGSGYTAAWYVLLTDGTPTVAAADTMASHAGWTEVTAYDEGTRQILTLGSVSGQSVDNSASKAVFTISANNTTIGGAGVVTDNTKGGSSGTLYGAGAFTAGDKTIDDDDVVNVTVTCTAAAA